MDTKPSTNPNASKPDSLRSASCAWVSLLAAALALTVVGGLVASRGAPGTAADTVASDTNAAAATASMPAVAAGEAAAAHGSAAGAVERIDHSLGDWGTLPGEIDQTALSIAFYGL